MNATGAPATTTHHGVLIAELRERIDLTLRPLLEGIRSAALLDFPYHSNVGDSAIWLGELAYLRSLGWMTLTYTCDVHSYSRDALAKHLDGGVILLSGGGNLGDLWEESQLLRERVIRDFPNNPIVQLPQSIHFQSRRALTRAKDVFDSHAALTLLLRDRDSLTFARNEFRNPSHLAPDMAFCLGPIERPCAATKEVLWLARTDQESASEVPSALATDIERVDWLVEPVTSLLRFKTVVDRTLRLYPRSSSGFERARARLWERIARQRLARGCRLLAGARTVLTDRLHGHVLSVLLGIPQLLLDNRTGKVRSFYDTWTSSLPSVRWCDTPAEAVALARCRARGETLVRPARDSGGEES